MQYRERRHAGELTAQWLVALITGLRLENVGPKTMPNLGHRPAAD